MHPSESSETMKWYVLNFIGSSVHGEPRKEIERFNSAFDANLELFSPTYVERIENDGQIRFRTVSLTFHYVFVKGMFDDVKQLCHQPNGFSFLLDRSSSERYAVIDDDSMEQFRIIARAYQNCLPYFSLGDIELEDGDLVEVVNGDFPGLKGRYIPRPKSKTGSIILRIYNNVATIAFNIKATDVRVLEFSRNSTRANDQIDAFVPHLLSALRSYHRNEPLPQALTAKLSVFCGRMGAVRLSNRKLDARLQILLYSANLIMGKTDESQTAFNKFQSVKSSVTNEWTLALIELILSVTSGNLQTLASYIQRILTLKLSSKAQNLILEEYKHYLTE